MPGSQGGRRLIAGALLLLFLPGGPLGCRSSAAAQTTPGYDLNQAVQELEANLQELRRNITDWQRLQRQPDLGVAMRAALLTKARSYLQACQDYDQALGSLPAAQLRRSPAGQRLLELRRIWQQEQQFLVELLNQVHPGEEKP